MWGGPNEKKVLSIKLWEIEVDTKLYLNPNVHTKNCEYVSKCIRI